MSCAGIVSDHCCIALLPATCFACCLMFFAGSAGRKRPLHNQTLLDEEATSRSFGLPVLEEEEMSDQPTAQRARHSLDGGYMCRQLQGRVRPSLFSSTLTPHFTGFHVDGLHADDSHGCCLLQLMCHPHPLRERMRSRSIQRHTFPPRSTCASLLWPAAG